MGDPGGHEISCRSSRTRGYVTRGHWTRERVRARVPVRPLRTRPRAGISHPMPIWRGLTAAAVTTNSLSSDSRCPPCADGILIDRH
eukprot:4725569-Pleurochrysis_carterae.AAC.6